jgi:peptidoglycan/xylan/chitin deacetylase (PgdA/CDA1 family)
MKRLALELMQTCGIFGLARAASSCMARILTYHNFCADGDALPDHVRVSVLRQQFEFLRRHFHVVRLSDLLRQLQSGHAIESHAVALTIDDGRRNCYQYLFPLLREFNIPATFFVVSSFVRREEWIWTDKIHWLGEHKNRPEELASDQIDAFFARLNQMRPEERNFTIESIATRMGVLIPQNPPPQYQPCSWDELREMADSGLVEIGSHTVTHPILSSITDAESWHELTVSREQIEEGLGGRIHSFCFPNGKPGDYRASQMRQLKDSGYAGAVVTRYGMVDTRSNPYELPRIGISGRTNRVTFAKYLDGAEYYQSKLQTSFRGAQA